MGTGAPSSSGRRKNPAEERKRRKKATAMARSGKRRRKDSPSSSSRSGHSSSSDFSSDSEDGDGGSRVRSSKKKGLIRRQRSPSRDGGSLGRQRKKRSSQVGSGRSKLIKGSHQKKGRHHRRRSSRNSRSASVSSLDEYSSHSCSTCRSCSSSCERTKSNRSRRSKGKVPKVSLSARGGSSRSEKERRGRSRSRRRHRSPSGSSCSRCNHKLSSRSRRRRSGSERHHGEERPAECNYFGHPLSTSPSNEMEGRYCGAMDGNRVEIIQDFDNLHTSRSNDSCEGGRKRDSGMAPLQHASEMKGHDDSGQGMRRKGHVEEADTDSKREISFSTDVTGHDDGAKWGNQNDSSMPREKLTRLKSQVVTCGDSSEADEVELLLRQKALENFKKFRARNSANTSSVGEQKYESAPIKSHEITSDKAEAGQLHEGTQPISVTHKQASYTSLEHHIPAKGESHILPFKSIADANAPALACSMIEKPEKNKKNFVQRLPSDTVNPESAPDILVSNANPYSKEFQASPSQRQIAQESSGKTFSEEGLSSKSTLLSSKSTLDKESSREAGNKDIHKKEAFRVDGSAPTDSSCHKSASEFEQKTMSVMRGGELVQVSYKVYIPKKTPALARRQLQR